MDWIRAILVAVGTVVWTVVKDLFSTDKPQERTVEHAEPDVEITHDEEDDQEKLRDLGL